LVVISEGVFRIEKAAEPHWEDFKRSPSLLNGIMNLLVQEGVEFPSPALGAPLSVTKAVPYVNLRPRPSSGLVRLSDGVTYKVTVEPADEELVD
jgi:hypothetical protein